MSTIFIIVHNIYLEKNRIFNHIENLNSERRSISIGYGIM